MVLKWWFPCCSYMQKITLNINWKLKTILTLNTEQHLSSHFSNRFHMDRIDVAFKNSPVIRFGGNELLGFSKIVVFDLIFRVKRVMVNWHRWGDKASDFVHLCYCGRNSFNQSQRKSMMADHNIMYGYHN